MSVQVIPEVPPEEPELINDCQLVHAEGIVVNHPSSGMPICDYINFIKQRMPWILVRFFMIHGFQQFVGFLLWYISGFIVPLKNLFLSSDMLQLKNNKISYGWIVQPPTILCRK